MALSDVMLGSLISLALRPEAWLVWGGTGGSFSDTGKNANQTSSNREKFLEGKIVLDTLSNPKSFTADLMLGLSIIL